MTQDYDGFKGIVAGIDPGSVTGLFLLTWSPAGGFWGQASQLHTQVDLLERLRTAQPSAITMERFVVGQHAARSANRHGQRAALDTIGAVKAAFAGRVPILGYTAGVAKTWATDERIRAAGLMQMMTGHALRHCRDAARHALYAGRFRFRWPDPLYPYGGAGHNAAEWADETAPVERHNGRAFKDGVWVDEPHG